MFLGNSTPMLVCVMKEIVSEYIDLENYYLKYLNWMGVFPICIFTMNDPETASTRNSLLSLIDHAMENYGTHEWENTLDDDLLRRTLKLSMDEHNQHRDKKKQSQDHLATAAETRMHSSKIRGTSLNSQRMASIKRNEASKNIVKHDFVDRDVLPVSREIPREARSSFPHRIASPRSRSPESPVYSPRHNYEEDTIFSENDMNRFNFIYRNDTQSSRPDYLMPYDPDKSERLICQKIQQLVKLPITLHPINRDGHCLFGCFTEFGSVKQIRESVADYYLANREYGVHTFLTKEERMDKIEDVLCQSRYDGTMHIEAPCESYGNEIDIVILVRLFNINVITVKYSEDREDMIFTIYLNKKGTEREGTSQITTQDPRVVQRWMYQGEVKLIGLEHVHWSLYEISL